MPYPRLSASAEALPLSMFARLYEKLASFQGDVIPLQIGDTHLLPPEPGRLDRQVYGADDRAHLFVDLSPAMGAADRDALCVLERIAGAGVLLAPGAPFGLAYARWARLCFTAVPEPRLLEGIARINRVVGGA